MEIADFKDKHKGERCFIIGTGPSLNKTNLSLLKNEICFGMNSLYCGMNDWNLSCKYYAVSDTIVWIKIYEDLMKIDAVFFLSEEICNTYSDTIDYSKCFVIRTVHHCSMWSHGVFSSDLEIGKVNGDTVLICCFQYAFYMGFKKVYLVGCDWGLTGHFDDEEMPDTTKQFLETGDFKYSMDATQRYAKSTISCNVCKGVYEMNGRSIINCTEGGNLEIFKRAKLEDVIEK